MSLSPFVGLFISHCFWPVLRVRSVLGACVHPKQLVVLYLYLSLSLAPPSPRVDHLLDRQSGLWYLTVGHSSQHSNLRRSCHQYLYDGIYFFM